MQDALDSVPLVLVVVPNGELRRSIEFALDAEGIAFSAHADLGAALAAADAPRVACLVIDEDAIAIRNGNGAGRGLDDVAWPVVLLVDRLRTVPQVPGIRVLNKPLLGRLLIDTVSGSMAAPASARPAT